MEPVAPNKLLQKPAFLESWFIFWFGVNQRKNQLSRRLFIRIIMNLADWDFIYNMLAGGAKKSTR